MSFRKQDFWFSSIVLLIVACVTVWSLKSKQIPYPDPSKNPSAHFRQLIADNATALADSGVDIAVLGRVGLRCIPNDYAEFLDVWDYPDVVGESLDDVIAAVGPENYDALWTLMHFRGWTYDFRGTGKVVGRIVQLPIRYVWTPPYLHFENLPDSTIQWNTNDPSQWEFTWPDSNGTPYILTIPAVIDSVNPTHIITLTERVAPGEQINGWLTCQWQRVP